MVATIFSSLAFLFSSVSMANLNLLVATSFSSLALLVTTFSSLSFLSNSFSSPHLSLLGVARRCFSLSSVSDDLFFSSCNFLVISDLIVTWMALIPIGPWKRDSTYRGHPLGLMDSTYRIPLLNFKLLRLGYAWYYSI